MMQIFILIIIMLLIIISFLLIKLLRIKKKEKQILDILEDIQNGNLSRRLLAHDNEITAELCYKINEIVEYYEEQLIQMNVNEKTSKQIITNLSHDLRTPLTTLIGYLDAIVENTVTGIEKEQYIKTAQTKAYALKSYTDDLFEWFKINADEISYHFEKVDINELSRNIIGDWIFQFEKMGFNYDINIADDELNVSLDVSAYTRILNNLIQNAIKHSGGSKINVTIKSTENDVFMVVTDDGKGIHPKDLPYVFERLYKADEARSIGSNGLGLSIIENLVKAHGATISVQSKPHVATTFSINMKKTR